MSKYPRQPKVEYGYEREHKSGERTIVGGFESFHSLRRYLAKRRRQARGARVIGMRARLNGRGWVEVKDLTNDPVW